MLIDSANTSAKTIEAEIVKSEKLED